MRYSNILQIRGLYVNFRLFLTAFFFCLSLIPAAMAQESASPLVKVRLLPEYSRIEPGQEFWVGIEQSIAPHWHTYWRNPGDSGSAPRIHWNLPEGFEMSEIYWPTPDKIPYPPLLNYGYSDHVILLQKLRAPETLPDEALTLKADVEILVCKDECIPEFSTHTLQLNDPAGMSEDNASYIKSALARLPENTDQSVSITEKDGQLIVTKSLADGETYSDAELASFEYFPQDWGLVDNTKDAAASIKDGALVITQPRGDRSLGALKQSHGLLAYTNENGARNALDFTAAHEGTGPLMLSAETMPEDGQETDISMFLQAALFALLGGLVLNLMPCVFPVLSIKALSLVKIAEKHPEMARRHGLAYTAGVVLSFLFIAGILIALKAGGAGIGWGFQLQNPIIVALLAYILFLVGLKLSGYFEISGHFGQVGNALTQGGGLKGSFFTGVLATLVATPCTAPFMALAIGYALTQSALVSLSVFAALGFGLALPYLALSFAPALQSRLPKPGAWMQTFQQFLAFPMFASAVWLVWVLGQQVGPLGMMGVLFGMVAIAFGLWLLNHLPEKGLGRFILKALVVLSFLAPIGLIPAGTPPEMSDASFSSAPIKDQFGQAYSPESLSALLAEDDPVFVEMTAAWCITCKVNHAVAINTRSTKAAFAEHNVKYVVGDWTNYDEEITKFLNSYGRDGVPIYVYYGARDAQTGERPQAQILPQILTPETIKKAIREAS
ncbi:MAG: thioredoxin family protein [Alphaproteobacteria bacterium]|nr:thioredoxin family protein [Alphaproteobacteria bacterium]